MSLISTSITTPAKTGKEAIEIAQTSEKAIDLAILDLVLPDLGGKDVYPLITKARPDMAVIVTSGYTLEGPAKEIMDAGAGGFLQKPFTINQLSEILDAVLGRGKSG